MPKHELWPTSVQIAVIGHDEIYVTFVEDKDNINISKFKNFLSKWGFEPYGIKKNSYGLEEEVYVKKMISYNKEKTASWNFPILKEKRNFFILPIESIYHTNLFTDMILKSENHLLYDDGKPQQYALKKIYITNAFDISASQGDIILIYRIGDRSPKRYSSVITGMAVLDEIKEFKNLDEYLSFCKNKTVFTEEELINIWKNSKKGRPKLAELIHLESFDKKITLDNLYSLGIIQKWDGPRPFTKINEDQFEILKKMSKGEI